MRIYWITGALIGVSALAKGVQDSIAHHNALRARGPWWNSDLSWQWKYEQPYSPDKAANRTERFWGSTRWFVALTDAWHFFGMVRDTCWQSALCLLIPDAWYYQLICLALIKIAYGFIFERMYQALNKQA